MPSIQDASFHVLDSPLHINSYFIRPYDNKTMRMSNYPRIFDIVVLFWLSKFNEQEWRKNVAVEIRNSTQFHAEELCIRSRFSFAMLAHCSFSRCSVVHRVDFSFASYLHSLHRGTYSLQFRPLSWTSSPRSFVWSCYAITYINWNSPTEYSSLPSDIYHR